MATILFTVRPERGHINPSLRIARTLQVRGHRVLYCGIPDIGELVRREGFEFAPIFEELFPVGFRDEMRARLSRLRGWGRRREEHSLDRRYEAAQKCILEGEFDRPFARARADLLICDVLMQEPPLVAWGHHIPTLLLNTTLPLRREPGLPPLSSPLLPDGGAVSRARIALTWLRVGGFTPLERWLEVPKVRYLHTLARKHGYPLEALDFSGENICARLPELVLCPQEFAELAVPRTRGEYLYVEPCIDYERQEPDFPWERLEASRPLVFFSLGTLASTTRKAAPLLRAAVAAAAQRPGWQLVLSLGGALTPEELGPLPANVIAVPHAPQLRLLRRASVMVTHGGFNSVKECIHAGVPMVVLPLQHDQPGISSRVVHHGLGVRLEPRRVTPSRLAHLVDTVLGTPGYKAATEAMRVRFLEAEEKTGAAQVIERFMDARGRPPTT
ncbi:glycosyltransferase [Archangium lipolyticum]|uniref:glycosyltransferase n=1 Tax=Archangium lipolyticum TaxID=2970465 RepID=UPI00214A10C0|nr:nucleotide disphospho-sugar-binding domain-containing protein [Archangium lipolyticum]